MSRRDPVTMTADALRKAAAALEDLIRLGARPRPQDDPAVIEAGITRLAATGFRPHYDLKTGISAVLTAEKAHA